MLPAAETCLSMLRFSAAESRRRQDALDPKHPILIRTAIKHQPAGLVLGDERMTRTKLAFSGIQGQLRYKSFVVAPFQAQPHGPLLESVALLQVEMRTVRCAVVGEREEMGGQGLQPSGVGRNDDLCAQGSPPDAGALLPGENSGDSIRHRGYPSGRRRSGVRFRGRTQSRGPSQWSVTVLVVARTAWHGRVVEQPGEFL